MTAPASEEKSMLDRLVELTVTDMMDMDEEWCMADARAAKAELQALRAALAERTRERDEARECVRGWGEARDQLRAADERATRHAQELARAKSDAAACAEAYLEVLKRWSESVGGCPDELHDDGCPQDDTCECPHVRPAHKIALAWAREERNDAV